MSGVALSDIGQGTASYLYVPGDRPDLMRKALGSSARAIILDLEDAVAPVSKDDARFRVVEFLESDVALLSRHEIWVRLNSGEAGLEDLDVVARARVKGFCLAKVDSEADVHAVAAGCERAELRLGISVGTISLMPLVESAAACLDAHRIAISSPRVHALQLGEVDLCADAGIWPSEDATELLLARSTVVLASAAARIDPPVAPVYVDHRDLAGLKKSTETLARLGFASRACIHPSQVGVVEDVFRPSAAQVLAAQKLVDAFDDALDRGDGICLDESGRMVDLAVVRRAQRIVASA